MRKVIAFLLVTALLLPVTLPAAEIKQAYAATSNAKKVISALDIMEIDKGTISENATKITRAQFAQLLVNLSALKDTTVSTSNVSLFKDVSKSYWASGYIKTAVANGWMTGYLDGSFGPTKGVTLMEAINGVLRLLGYSDSDFTGNVTGTKLALYKSLELNKNITVTKTSSYLSYANCVTLFYNTLNAKTKNGNVYAEALGYSLDADGELDYLSLINEGTEGPIIADDSWINKLPFSIYGATVYKNDTKCTYNDIRENDVLYYSKSFETIWAYDSKVTGVITAISPDLLNPTSITVAGVAYEFENNDAVLEFTALGSVEKGDIITLLLGKNGGIAGVLSQDEYNTTVTGIVLSVGTHLAKNDNGDYVSTAYATYADAAGNKYTQDYDSSVLSLEQNDLIRITYKGGTATVAEYAMPGFTFNNATVSSDGTVFGTMKFSSNVKILDYSEGTYTTIYPTRLAGMIIQDSKIYYYDTNADGEITNLILKDATGDLDSYGIFTGFSYSGSAGSYGYILNGTSASLSKSSYSNFTIEKGPVGLVYENGSIAGSYALTKVTVAAIGNTTITSGVSKYPLADKLSVYVVNDDGTYVQITIGKINTTKYTVTAYYDQAITLGGRIRVIIAVPNN